MSFATATLLIADAARGSQDPGTGIGIGLIVAAVIGVVLVAAVLFAVFHRLSRASRGGVRERPGAYRRGNPPFESVGRRR